MDPLAEIPEDELCTPSIPATGPITQKANTRITEGLYDNLPKARSFKLSKPPPLSSQIMQSSLFRKMAIVGIFSLGALGLYYFGGSLFGSFSKKHSAKVELVPESSDE